jgi:hypothetical protein
MRANLEAQRQLDDSVVKALFAGGLSSALCHPVAIRRGFGS